MGRLLNTLKSNKISKAQAINNPWGLARYLANKHDGVPKDVQRGDPGYSKVSEYEHALSDTNTQNRRGKMNRVSGTAATYGRKGVKTGKGAKERRRARSQALKSFDDHVTQFVNFLSQGNIQALNKMLVEVDDSPEGLFMQAVRKAMGIHGEQYKDIGKPQFLKKAQSKPLQKVSSSLIAFLAGLGLSDEIVRSGGGSPRGDMTPAQQREWERMLNRQMKRKSLKDGVAMEDLQKHWSDTSDTYVRRVPVAKGVQAGETFLDKKLSAPPRPGEVWNPVSHRWTKEGNLGKVNVGSGGKKRLRAGSSAAGAHQKNVGGLSGKGRLRHLGTGRHFRGKIDIAEQAQGTKAGVGSGKSPTSVFRTGAKTGITSPKAKAKSGAFRSTPTRRSKRRPKSRNSGKRSNLNVNQI